MKIRNVCVLGGTGFVGTPLVSRLQRSGRTVRVPTRHRHRHRHLLVLPNVALRQADVHDLAQLEQQFEGVDAVINLVGILNERGFDGSGFRRAHTELASKVVTACQRAGVPRLIHMSALNADPEGASHYLRTKGEAEQLVHEAEGLAVTTLRPSVIFGPGDGLFGLFAMLLKLSPVIPLGSPNARMAPVYIGDLIDACMEMLENPAWFGKRVELCGPECYTLKELVEYTAHQLALRRWIIPLSAPLARLQARSIERLPGKKLLSMDNYLSLTVDSVCSESYPCNTTLDAVVPHYLADQSQRGRYQALRRQARHG